MYQYELAGCLTEHTYKESIPKECAHESLPAHEAMMLCWGLVRAIEKGHAMNCRGCPETKENHRQMMIRIEQKKNAKTDLSTG